MPRQRKSSANLFWKDGAWHGRKEIKGKVYRFNLHTSDRAIAKSRLPEHLEKLATRVRYGSKWTTWDEAVKAWSKYYVADRGIEASTIRRYVMSIKQLMPHLTGKFVDATAIGEDGIDASLISNIVRIRRDAGVTTATIRRDLTAVASVLNYCQHEGLRENNPALDRSRLLRERRDPIVLPEPAHVERIIAAAPGLMGPLIRAAWLTGCRQSELVYATRADLDLRRAELRVLGKGNKVRTVDLKVFDAIELFRSLPPTIVAPQYLFWHGAGPYKAISGYYNWMMARAAAADPEFRTSRFHDLRHLHAVQCLQSGMSIYMLKERLGHSSVTITESVYLKHLTPEQALAAKMARTA